MRKSTHDMTLKEYQEWNKTLEVYTYLSPEFIERFWMKVDVGSRDECWPFQSSSRNQCDYGLVWYGPRKEGGTIAAHKLAYILGDEHTWEEPIRKNEVIMHKCRTRSSSRDHDLRCCCNPLHLKRGTQKENIHDAIEAGTFRPFGRMMLIARGGKTRRQGEY